MKRIHLLVTFSIMILLFTGISTAFSNNTVKFLESNSFEIKNNDDFFFVQITDTHVLHNIFDRPGNSKMRLTNVLKNISNFEEKPAFVAITGDLVEWGGSGSLGALNYQTFIDCFYELDGQFYADSDFNIPIYTTPGNHDYVWENKLTNYNKYVKDENRYVVTLGDSSFFFIDSGANYILEPWDWVLILGSGLYDDDIAWLDEELSTCESSNKIILMHHPAVSTRDEFGRMKDVIARNRENFVDLCEQYNVEIVLTGHTHSSRVFDDEENLLTDLPLNCNDYSTLYVQTDDCKQGIHYRNISVTPDGVILEQTQELEYNPLIKPRLIRQSIINKILDILKNR
ncbi:MAG: metallophosphoesterase [Thermoplasmatales archaeon]|nr:metallophosphoesterase [Thermoplasmatales archaeon]